jgi:hypothetical protein
MKIRTIIPAAAAALALAAPAAAQTGYTPFVTDFGKARLSDPTPASPIPAAAVAASGPDWADVSAGAGAGAALVAALGGAVIVLTRRGRGAHGAAA